MEYSDNHMSLLYVDDEPILLEVTKQYLENKCNFSVATASSAIEALNRIQEQKYDAIISDYQMPEMDGLEFLRKLRAEGNTTPFIIFTGRGREEVAIEALNAGADYYLHKGGKPKVQFGELQNFVYQAVKKNRAEKGLLENEQRMADIINFLPDATFAIDNEGRIIAWNRAIEEMTGSPASEMLGKGDYEYTLPFYNKRHPVLIDLVLHEELRKEVPYNVLNYENRKKCFAEIFIPHFREGKGAHLWFVASPLYDTDGNITGAIESIRDITKRKNSETDLITLNKKLNLLSSVTRHDIVNQLSGLMIYEEMLNDNLSEEKVKNYLEPMIVATEKIERIIAFTHDYQVLGVQGPTWQSVASCITDSGIKVKADTGTLEIFADPMLAKVSLILSENAVRHGEHATEMNVSFHEKEGKGILVIEDNGVGIADNMKESIFEHGVGLNTGFGLFMAKEILEITGISISETGTEGKGARFEITVPEGGYRFGN